MPRRSGGRSVDDARGALADLRGWWLRRQGLTPATAPETIEACVRQAGWLPTFTGIYLSIRARMPGVPRQVIDRAAMDGVALIEVPGAHGRPAVLVPRDEMALALRLHAATFERHLAPHFANGSISEAALRGVEAQVCRMLDEGPLPTADLRKSLQNPDADELLVTALVNLTLRGAVHRYPVDGRLDSSKYMYELRHPHDRPRLDDEGDSAAVVTKAVALFLHRHGPATVEELTWWSGVTVGAARRALATLGAEPLTVQGWTREAWLLPEDVRAWRSFKGDRDDRVTLLPYRDPLVHMHRPPAVLSTKIDARVLDPTLKQIPIGDVDTLYHHAILSGGTIVGVWEYDPEADAIVTRVWEADAKLKRRVADAAADMATFIREQLGDVKLSAVDPPPKRARRIAFCRATAQHPVRS